MKGFSFSGWDPVENFFGTRPYSQLTLVLEIQPYPPVPTSAKPGALLGPLGAIFEHHLATFLVGVRAEKFLRVYS